jgi:hypothetical protein
MAARERVEQDKLTKRIRTKRSAVATNKAQDRKANLNQVAARITDLEALALAQARLLAILTDPTDADLVDDDA